MKKSLPLDYAPMEASAVESLPTGDDWQYEPKWDGFRCIAFRTGDDVELMSKSGKPLTRYFPEVAANLLALKATTFVLDGEIVIVAGKTLSFDDLLQRIHPAASRVKKLSAETPATYVVFDLLADAKGSRVELALGERRALLESFAAKQFTTPAIVLSPATDDVKTVMKWFDQIGGGLDGVMAKRTDLPYQSGERTGMQKLKHSTTIDCVVGGFRYASAGKQVGSLLLGLYNDEGLLDHVGFMSGIKQADRAALTRKVEALRGGTGFTGNAPGGPSRWSTERSAEWVPLKPELVVEVSYDHFTGGRFRHGTGFVRWRPDKAPRQCTMAQLPHPGKSAMNLVKSPVRKRR